MTQSLQNNEQRKRPYWLKPMRMRDGRLSAYRRLKMRRSGLLRYDSMLWPVILLLIVMLSACCQVPPIPPSEPPSIPTVPALQQQLPKETYSISVQRDLLRWEKQLTDMSLTSKP